MSPSLEKEVFSLTSRIFNPLTQGFKVSLNKLFNRALNLYFDGMNPSQNEDKIAAIGVVANNIPELINSAPAFLVLLHLISTSDDLDGIHKLSQQATKSFDPRFLNSLTRAIEESIQESKESADDQGM